ncbi:unnamed protein product [Protopolystoma xenopodis]|uniref:Uncharacterized protein n=1 Tax=Protopolystoma xenopodis TaxID=117903 RepID=A0A3S5C2V0_9PLAT|nr:unnamed protein product [Protopolystoma xenopodis]
MCRPPLWPRFQGPRWYRCSVPRLIFTAAQGPPTGTALAGRVERLGRPGLIVNSSWRCQSSGQPDRPVEMLPLRVCELAAQCLFVVVVPCCSIGLMVGYILRRCIGIPNPLLGHSGLSLPLCPSLFHAILFLVCPNRAQVSKAQPSTS